MEISVSNSLSAVGRLFRGSACFFCCLQTNTEENSFFAACILFFKKDNVVPWL
jgi:hypothetical protein